MTGISTSTGRAPSRGLRALRTPFWAVFILAGIVLTIDYFIVSPANVLQQIYALMEGIAGLLCFTVAALIRIVDILDE